MKLELLKKLMEEYKKELQSGEVVEYKNFQLFINTYGNYVCVIDKNTNQEIFPS